MKYIYFALVAFLLCLPTAQASSNQMFIPLQTISDSMLIYYRLDSNGGDTCTDNAPISLGNFVKKTLGYEWIDDWGNTSGGIESLKAGAIAVRTFTISAYNADIINVNGQNYYCTKAWRQQGFNLANAIRPNSSTAVNATNGVYLTHPNATSMLGTKAINAQYRDETGWFTNDGPHPWLKEVFDPVSSGTPQQGMGQHGSRRWAWGQDDSGNAYPKWDYRRILAHYYSEVEFVGISPTPPTDYRSNILEVAGLAPNGGFTICKGEVKTGYNINFQNTGNAIPVDNASLPGLCSGVTNPQTGVGYHIYKADGSGLACVNCEGVRVGKLCYPGSSIPSGKNVVSYGFEVFMPNVGALLEGNSYLLRFDIRRNGVWQGRNAGFPWPSQDIPVQIVSCGSSGGDDPSVIVDYPPAVVSHGNLNNGRYGFSWSGVNAETYDLEYRSKEIGQANYNTGFTTLLSDSSAQQFSATVGCNEDRLDWQFRLRGRDDNGGPGDWAYVQSQMRVYPHPWPSYSSIAGLVLDEDPGPWSRTGHILNLGGGSFNWTASDDQSWITTATSGQGEGSLGIVLSKAGSIGDYFGTITVNTSNPQPTPSCNSAPIDIPVGLYIREELDTYYFPIIFKNGQ